ncbi:MAG: squalene--hopene cyclase, partial [Chloroflexi bacterium]|nr:squalene--hopene cyclase [Chloroflexota bacterium]
MTTPRAVSTPDQERLQRSVEAAQRWLLEDQHPEGFWWGELESNTSITSEYLLLTHHLGIGDPERWAEIAAYLRGKQ